MATAEVFESSCPQCAKVFRALSKPSADGALRLHLNRVHGTGRRKPRGAAPEAAVPAAAAPAPAPQPAAQPARPRPAREGSGAHAHHWRLLRPDRPPEAAAIRRGYVRVCDECREVSR